MTRRPRTRAAARLATLVALCLALDINDASAYLKFGVTTSGNQVVALKWSTLPVRYFVTNGGVPGVSANDFQAAVSRAFSTERGTDGIAAS